MDRLKAEGVFTGGNHGQRNRVTVALSVEVLSLKPSAKPGIIDIRLVTPKARVKTALYLKMIQLQFDDRDPLGKVAPDIVDAYMQPSEAATFALCSDHHTYLLFNVG
ncbi:MAG: hypothetical protein WCA11_17875 [Terracidiphilus sp.]